MSISDGIGAEIGRTASLGTRASRSNATASCKAIAHVIDQPFRKLKQV